MQDGNFWGGLIVSLREEQKLSQRQLAAMTPVNRGTLRRIEEGKVAGDISIIERLLTHLGYELEAVAKGTQVECLRERQQALEDPTARSRMAAKSLLVLQPF